MKILSRLKESPFFISAHYPEFMDMVDITEVRFPAYIIYHLSGYYCLLEWREGVQDTPTTGHHHFSLRRAIVPFFVLS